MSKSVSNFFGKVIDITLKGMGVLSHDLDQSKKIFSWGVWIGDEGEFEIIEDHSKYAIAKPIHLTQLSSHRIENPCAHQGFGSQQCGGCPWINFDYSSQIKIKEELIQLKLNQLNLDIKVNPILSSENIFHYRNRTQFKTNGKIIGYNGFRSHEIVPIKECKILEKELFKKYKFLKSSLPQEEWKPTGQYDFNFIELDDETNERNVIINKRRPFKQANSSQNEKMKNWLKELFKNNSKDQTILELFAGSGNFTQVLSKLNFENIISIESDSSAIKNLKKYSEALRLDLYQPKNWQKLNRYKEEISILILDPPRTGFSHLKDFIENFPNLNQIIYISCDPESYFNDIKSLVSSMNWKINQIQPIDQFPHTPHIELMTELVL